MAIILPVQLFTFVTVASLTRRPGRRGEESPTRTFRRYDAPVTVARAVWVNQPLGRRNDVAFMLQQVSLG